MAVGSWLTPAEARTEPYWPGPQGDPYDDDALEVLLTSAREQCETYLPDDQTFPSGYVSESHRMAQSLQARALYRAGLSNGDNIGVDGLTLTVFPLDWTVKQLLRPKRGRPILR